MTQTFKVTNPQEKEWGEKRFVEATLQTLNVDSEPEGEKYQVSFWSGEISIEGGLYRSTVSGELSKNDKGYWRLSTPKQTAGANFKTMQTEKLMEKKEASISKFQDSKEQSIKIASTMNKAVELAIAEYANPNSLLTMQELIEKWRKYLWSEWDKIDQYPPF